MAEKIKSKRAELMSLWWFFVLAVIGAGIITGVLIFYSERVDIRLAESSILSGRLVECLSQQGYLINNFNEEDFNIFDACGFDEKIINKSGNYYFRVSLQDGAKVLKEIRGGNSAFEEDCGVISFGVKGEYYPICSEKSVYILDSSGKKIKLNIVSGSNSEYR